MASRIALACQGLIPAVAVSILLHLRQRMKHHSKTGIGRQLNLAQQFETNLIAALGAHGKQIALNDRNLVGKAVVVVVHSVNTGSGSGFPRAELTG